MFSCTKLYRQVLHGLLIEKSCHGLRVSMTDMYSSLLTCTVHGAVFACGTQRPAAIAHIVGATGTVPPTYQKLL